MGFHGMSIGSLLLILVIVLVLFGTKRLKNAGSDLGAAIKAFQEGLKSQAPVQPSASEKDKE